MSSANPLWGSPRIVGELAKIGGEVAKSTVEKYMVRFADIIVKEEGDGIEDGVLGSSFLANFDATIRFSTMTLKLERPVDRRLRAESEAAPGRLPPADGTLSPF